REALAARGELVGELHRDAAAQRMADHGRAFDAERPSKVAQRVGQRAERIVAGALGRASVAGQVDRDDLMPSGETLENRRPGVPIPADPVNQEHGGAFATGDVGKLTAVKSEGAVS